MEDISKQLFDLRFLVLRAVFLYDLYFEIVFSPLSIALVVGDIGVHVPYFRLARVETWPNIVDYHNAFTDPLAIVWVSQVR